MSISSVLSGSIPGVVFLDVAAQTALGYKVTPLLPYDRYTRKTVGYLYAIEVRNLDTQHCVG